MKTALKIVITLGSFALLLYGALFVLGFGLIGPGPESLAAIKAAKAQGQKRGNLLDEAGCLNEALARHKADAKSDIDFRKHIVDPAELRACLQSSRALEGFCKDVPYKDASLLEWKDQQAERERAAASRAQEEARVKEWVARACSQQRLSSDVDCASLMGAVVNYCSSPARADKLAHKVPQPPPEK